MFPTKEEQTRMRHFKQTTLSLAAAQALMVMALPVMAQTTEAPKAQQLETVIVSGQRAVKVLAGQHPGQHPHGRARVSRVELTPRAPESGKPHPADAHDPRMRRSGMHHDGRGDARRGIGRSERPIA